MESPVPLSELKQPQPPKAPGPSITNLLIYAVTGLLIGFAAQEFRWRGSLMVPQNQMAQAEKDVKAGDYNTAVTMFEKLAANNHPLADYWVAHMTELGLGTPRDPAKAVELYKKAAAQDVAAAELRLGEIYLHGDLVLPDFAQAKTYLERAAYHGGPRAAMLLGQMYRDGLGMPADQKEAYAWSEVATLEGSAFASRDRDATFHDLSATEKNTAIARAQDILKIIKSETPPAKPPIPK
jgi:TPR repeat protein